MEAMHSQDLSIMVAIACGTRKQVRYWGEILRGAAIDYLVAEGVENLPEDANARAEVWVFQSRCRRSAGFVAALGTRRRLEPVVTRSR